MRRAMDHHALVARFGSPLYVYDLATVRARARALRAAISHAPFQPLFALKANSCPAVVRTILAEGFGCDAVSPGEVALALRLGVKPGLVLYTENNMDDAEQATAVAQGVTVTCGSLDRLARLAAAGARSCAVRFNPDIGAGAHAKICTGGPLSKFGVHHTQVDEVLRLAPGGGKTAVVGCHMHIGSGFLDADAFVAAMGVILTIALRLPDLRFVDFGGGLGIPYRAEEAPIDLARVGREASRLMAEFDARHRETHRARNGNRPPLELRLEPGRFLVAEAGTLLTTVTSVKTYPAAVNPDGTPEPARTYVGCDTGFNHLVRAAMYDAWHRIDNLSNPRGEPTRVDVVGNICESGDVFARDRHVPQPRLGDLLAIRDAGAYGMAMASTYNLRPLPAEVVVDGGEVRLARARQTVEQLLDGWIW